MYTHIIWDFNGTIADDVTAGITSVNTMLKKRGLPVLTSHDDYRRKFKFPIIEYYRDLGFDFEKESYESLADEWVGLYKSGIPDMTLFDGVESAVSEIWNKNPDIFQVIISSSEISMMENQLECFGIRKYFNQIYGLDNIFAGGKSHLVKMWNETCPHGDVLFIGDTIHDYEVSLLVENSDCLLFTQGHGNLESLKSCGVPLIDSIYDSVRYILS